MINNLQVVNETAYVIQNLVDAWELSFKEADDIALAVLEARGAIEIDLPGKSFIFDGKEGCYIKDGIIYHELEEMPFDRYEDGKGFIHATGREKYDLWYGNWSIEWEDDLEEEE